jgi:hypothetical protein
MASGRTLSHNPSLVDQINAQVTTQWTRIGENVGYGTNSASLQNAFMNSTAHRNNILGDYNRVGIGAAYDSGGTLWVTLDFVKGPDLAPAPPAGLSPFGQLDSAWQVLGGVRVSGWALDPDTAWPIEVHIYVDWSGANLGPASASRPDIGQVYPAYGPGHGFDAVVGAPPGWHNVCAYGINVGGGVNMLLGCRQLMVDPSPFGQFDSAQQVVGGIRVSGWALDPETAWPVEVHIYVDNGGTNLSYAWNTRPDVGAYFSYAGYGANHGFDGVVGAGPGAHWVCAYAINVGAGSNTSLGCRTVIVNPNPLGSFDVAAPSGAGIRVAGWALDPDTSSPIQVHVYIDGAGTNLGPAANARPDVGSYFSYAGYGSSHGFDSVVPTTPGTHQVCAYAINVGMGANTPLGCKTVSV